MSALLFLSADDFVVKRGQQSNLLCNALTTGFSFVLFYSTQCGYCRELVPIFKSLSGSVLGVQFGLVNVVKERRVVQMSHQTACPLTYVPYMVFYVNGRPFMRYKGPYDADEIRRFLVEVAAHITDNQQFGEGVTVSRGPVQEYCVGVPLHGEDNVCYLKDEEAYN